MVLDVWEPGIVLFAGLGGSRCPKTYCKFSLLLVRKYVVWQKSVFLEDLPFLVVWVWFGFFLFSRLPSYTGV